MNEKGQYHGRSVEITTEHPTSSHGMPVLLLDGAVLDSTRGGQAEDIALCLLTMGTTASVRNAAAKFLNSLPPNPPGTVGAFGVDFSGERHNFKLEEEVRA